MSDEQTKAVARYTSTMLDLSESYGLDVSDLISGFESVNDEDLQMIYDVVAEERGFCTSYCMSCEESKFYDQWEKAYYCPVCESQS